MNVFSIPQDDLGCYGDTRLPLEAGEGLQTQERVESWFSTKGNAVLLGPVAAVHPARVEGSSDSGAGER